MPVPSSLSLTSIADGAQIIASDHRNNYAAIQAAVNALIAFYGGGSVGDLLKYDGTDWAPESYAWTSFTPALTASTTSPTLGTGSADSGKYVQLGKIVVCSLAITFGTSGVAAGSGTYRITLPVNASAGFVGLWAGQGLGYDSSAGTSHQIQAAVNNASYIELWDMSANSYVTASAPWTWAASDQIKLVITYEAA